MTKLIIFGSMGDKTVYLNKSVEEAAERYFNENKYCFRKDVTVKDIIEEAEVIPIDDKFYVYDIWSD